MASPHCLYGRRVRENRPAAVRRASEYLPRTVRAKHVESYAAGRYRPRCRTDVFIAGTVVFIAGTVVFIAGTVYMVVKEFTIRICNPITRARRF
jgi:hypothetical protein